MLCVERAQEIQQALSLFAGLRHIRCAAGAADEPLEREALDIRKRVAVRGREEPGLGDDTWIEVDALDSDFAANVEDRLTIPGSQRIGLCCGGST